MVKKIISLIVSTRLTAILFITFSAAMGIGTFIELWLLDAVATMTTQEVAQCRQAIS